jgi:hypothetical protein
MNIKLLPYNPRGTVDISAVAAISITPGTRSQKPYPPGKVQVNGDYWPDGKTYVGDVTLTWVHRNRTAQANWAVVAQDAASVAAGPEGTYTVEVLIDGAVIPGRTTAGITGTSFTYTLAQRTADDADLSKQVHFRITPVNGALSGTSRTTDPFIMQS